MTSRERVECAIRFEEPDRVPYNFWMDRRRMAELDARYGPEFRVLRYDVDVIESYECFPPFPAARHEAKNGTTWMVEELFDDWRRVRDFTLPDPTSPKLYERLDYHLKAFPDRAIIVNSAGVLTITEMMRKQESLYTDFLMQPDEVLEAFDRFSDVMAAVAERVCRRDITALYVQDDIAYNGGLLIAPDLARHFVFPCWKKVIDVGRAHGKPVFFHTDGKCDDIWEVFCNELGVRMLNPLQPTLQDLSDYKARYHGRMGIYGGIATDRLHVMSPDEIRRHVRELFEQTGKGGGLIMSTHDIDYTITDEQLDAFADAVHGCAY